MENHILHSGKVFRPIETSLFKAWEEVKIPAGTPDLEWQGSKIPFAIWWPVVAFMRKNHEHECMARFYYHVDRGEWKAWVWPQKYGTGMTITEYSEHPLRERQWAEQFGPGWEPCGTVHHHCSASAFQSGTDHADEKTQPGIHITLGKMKDAELDIHMRASFRQNFFSCGLLGWFELLPQVIALPVALWEGVTKYFALRHLPHDCAWPTEWDANLIEEPRIVTGVWNAGGYSQGAAHNGNQATVYRGTTCVRGEDGIYYPPGQGPKQNEQLALPSKTEAEPEEVYTLAGFDPLKETLELATFTSVKEIESFLDLLEMDLDERVAQNDLISDDIREAYNYEIGRLQQKLVAIKLEDARVGLQEGDFEYGID